MSKGVLCAHLGYRNIVALNCIKRSDFTRNPKVWSIKQNTFYVSMALSTIAFVLPELIELMDKVRSFCLSSFEHSFSSNYPNQPQ